MTFSLAIATALLVIGSVFIFLSGIGIFKMPDTFMRMQVATKASTLGLACLLVALAIHFHRPEIYTRCILIIAFIFLTGPVGAHMIGRASYFIGVKIHDKTQVDEMKNLIVQYQDEKQHGHH
jgi:multicomponent Na+:H+ antiporter subunit G